MKNKKISIILLIALLTLSITNFAACGGNDEGPPKTITKPYSYNENSIELYKSDNIPYSDEMNSNETQVFITPYLANDPSGGAVIVFPGGGYSIYGNDLESESEGADIATEYYNDIGISVFVARYRVNRDSSNVSHKSIMTDGQRAVKWVRYYANEYNVDPEKIAVLGYSAGGNLAMQLCTHPEWTCDDPSYIADAIDGVSGKPNAGILSYAVCSFKTGYTNVVTCANFTKNDATLMEKYSGENSITGDTPPMFIWGCNDDNLTKSAAMLAQALEKENVPYEFHSFNKGGHGIGLAKASATAYQWGEQSSNWLKSLGYCGVNAVGSDTTMAPETENAITGSALEYITDFSSHPIINIWSDSTSEASIIPYIKNNSDSTVLIFQGGGNKAYNKAEGVAVAEELNEAGYSAFIVKYSLGSTDDNLRAFDAEQALKFVKNNASIFGISGKIGVIGFGSGTQLAKLVCESSNSPDFGILCSPELADTNAASINCPLFLWYLTGSGEKVVSLTSELLAAGAVHETQGYSKTTAYPIGLADSDLLVSQWFDNMLVWLNAQNI